jgi:hypothetical protein
VTDLERELLELHDRVSESIKPSPEMAHSVFRRAKIRRVVTFITGVLVAGALGFASFSAVGALTSPTSRNPAGPQREEENPTPPVLDFEAASGWHVVTTDPAVANDIGVQAWASNGPFAANEEPVGEPNAYPDGWPDQTEKNLPPDGIVIVASYQVQTRNALPPNNVFPERTLPLTIDERPSAAYEGGDPDRARVMVNATVNGRYVSVAVVFGTGDPARQLVNEAEEELARLIVAPSPTTTESIDDFGIRMSLPEEWQGILFRWPAGAPALHAATVPITDLYGGSSVRKELGAEDVFLLLSENDAAAARYEPVALPVTVRTDDSCPTCEVLDNGTSPPSDHSLFYRSFAVAGRQFDLFVELGTATPTDDQLARLNDVLATLQIAPPESSAPAESPAVVQEAPISVNLPAGWIEKEDPVPGSVAPRVVAAFGTWDFPTGGGCGPEEALQQLPEDGALVWVVEHASPGNAGDYISPPPRFSLDLQEPPARWECAAGAPSRKYLFRIGGRFFDVHLALGPDATGAIISQAEDLIDSLQAEPSS